MTQVLKEKSFLKITPSSAFYIAQGYSDVGNHQEAVALHGRASQHLMAGKQQVVSLGGSRKTSSRISADDAEELKKIEASLQQAEVVLKRGLIGEKAKIFLKKTTESVINTTTTDVASSSRKEVSYPEQKSNSFNFF